MKFPKFKFLKIFNFRLIIRYSKTGYGNSYGYKNFHLMKNPAAEQRGIEKPTHKAVCAPQRGGELDPEKILKTKFTRTEPRT